MTFICLVAAGNGYCFLRCAAHCTTIRLGTQHRNVSALHNAAEIAFIALIINRDDIPKWIRCSLGRGGLLPADVVALPPVQPDFAPPTRPI